MPLAERARRVNEVCARYGANNVLLVSIHCNAAGSGEWMNARGWSAYTTKGKTKADELANRMYDAAACFITGQKIRRDYSDGDPDWEENFYILPRRNVRQCRRKISSWITRRILLTLHLWRGNKTL